MDELVMVIVPAWNAENYIEATLRSVLAQTYRALRIFVVDDGSTDTTPQILARLAAEDPRLSFVTVANGGPAAARNCALARLPEETRWVMFLDADDQLLPEALETALANGDGADLVLFGYAIRRQDGSLRPYCEPEELLDREGLARALPRLYKANLLNQVWAKLFAAPILEGLRFPDYRWGEDRLFLFDALERAETIKVLPQILHRYIMHEGESLITRYYEKKFDVCCEIDGRLEELCAGLGVREDAPFRYMFLKSVWSCLTTLYSPSCRLSRSEKREVARRILADGRVRRRCRDTGAGLPAETLCALLRSGSPGLALAGAQALAWSGERFPRLFMAMKHRK